MKKLSLLLCICAMALTGFAQLPNGSYAPAFTGYEIDKTNGSIISTNPIVLHDLTDAGYVVYIDVFATWCGPCWNFHNTGAFETLYTQYGPNGTNEVRVMGIEGSSGNYASLSGTGPDAGGSGTQGNWLNGVEYPIIPLAMSPNTTAFDNDYAISYFPTVYMVCPNRLVYEVGQTSAANLYAAASSMCPQYDNTLANNGLLLKTEGFDGVYFCSCTATPTVTLQNVGSAPLTSVSFTIDFDGQTSTFDWTGNLTKYNTVNVSLPQVTTSVDGAHNYSVTINTVNGVADADAVMNTASTTFNVNINPTSSTVNEAFTSGIPSDWANPEGLLFTHDLGGEHGNAVVFNAYQFESGTIANLYLPYEDLSSLTNPILVFDLAHKRYNSSYSERLRVMYSTDCGASWNSVFSKSGSSLSTSSGTTTSNFIPTNAQWRDEVVDLSGITDNDAVIIRFEFKSGYGNNVWIDNVRVMNATGLEELDSELSIYPNPATEVVNISTADEVQRVEIFNMQGQLVKVENGDVNTVSVKELANGVYTIKLTTANGTSMHKIVKK